jgi:hypothetical protein
MIHQRLAFAFTACRDDLRDEESVLAHRNRIYYATIEICEAALQ